MAEDLREWVRFSVSEPSDKAALRELQIQVGALTGSPARPSDVVLYLLRSPAARSSVAAEVDREIARLIRHAQPANPSQPDKTSGPVHGRAPYGLAPNGTPPATPRGRPSKPPKRRFRRPTHATSKGDLHR